MILFSSSFSSLLFISSINVSGDGEHDFVDHFVFVVVVVIIHVDNADNDDNDNNSCYSSSNHIFYYFYLFYFILIADFLFVAAVIGV